MWCEWRAMLYLSISLSVPACLLSRSLPCSLGVRYTVMFADWLRLLHFFKKSRFKWWRQIVDANCLFLFVLLLWLISALLKCIHWEYRPTSPSPFPFPVSLCSIHFLFLWVGLLYVSGMGCDSLSVALFVQSLFSFCVSVPPLLLFQKSGMQPRQESTCWFFDTLFHS